MTATVASISGRWLHHAGRIMSAENLVGAFGVPAKKQKTQATTGPFDLNPANRRTGFTEYDDLVFEVWADLNYPTLITMLNGTDTSERIVMWGHSSDVVLTDFDAAAVIKTEFTQDTPAAELIKFTVKHVIRDGGLEHGILLHAATAAETANGNTEGAPHNNGVYGSAATVSSSSVANPSIITTAAAHGFQTGDTVLIASHSGSTPSINGSHVITRVSSTTFSIPVNVTVGGTGGTATRTSSRGGGALYVQLFGLALDGGDSFSITGRDSVDGVTFADLATTGAIATEYSTSDPDVGTAVRVAVSGSIDRYTAVAWAWAGSPGAAKTATFQAGVTRVETN